MMYDIKLYNTVEYYNKILDTVVSEIEPFVQDNNISMGKTQFYQEITKYEQSIILQLPNLKSIEAFCISLFIFRTVAKNYMHKNQEVYTYQFKVYNYLFFLVNKNRTQNISASLIFPDEKNTIRYIFSAVHRILKIYNLLSNGRYNPKYIDLFFSRINQISNKIGDLHSYTIQSPDLQVFLNKQNLTIDQLTKNALKTISDSFYSISELEKEHSWNDCVSKYNVSHPRDPIIIFPRGTLDLLKPRLKNFFKTFDAHKCQNPYDAESDMIFCFETNQYTYISKTILKDTQVMIECFTAWGQYDNLLSYFWGRSINQKNLKNYNRLLTYKIADLLLANQYLLPTESKNKLTIPQIEISKYYDKKSVGNIGDIDVVFYSKTTCVLYLIEYKNYQMIVSRRGDLDAEISKVEREKTPDKVLRRLNYVKKNLSDFLCIFNGEIKVRDVRSIILTTKPNFYFFVYKNQEYDYMDWIEFEEHVKNKDF